MSDKLKPFYPKAEKENRLYVFNEVIDGEQKDNNEQKNNQIEIANSTPLSLKIPTESKKKGFLNFIKNNLLFFYLFIVPTLIAAVYFFVIAKDIYITESKFIVKTTENQSLLPESFTQMAFGTNTNKESYSVHDYILSRDSLNDLNKKYFIKEKYSIVSTDLLSVFPGIFFWKDSLEKFHQYYLYLH